MELATAATAKFICDSDFDMERAILVGVRKMCEGVRSIRGLVRHW